MNDLGGSGRPEPIRRRTLLLAHPSADLYGSDRVFLETVEAFVRDGADVVVTMPADGPLSPLLVERGARVRIVPTLVLRKRLLTPRGFGELVSQTVRGLRAGGRLMREVQPDLVWTNTITIPLWTALARLRRLPSVVHVHEAEGSAKPIVMRALAFPLLFADRLIANSSYSAKTLERSYARLADRTTVVLNGVPGPSEVTAPRTDVLDELRVLFVGRLSPRKGPDLVIEAVDELNRRGIDARADIVGAVYPGYEWFEDELRASIAARDLADRVTLLGFQPTPWPALAASDVLVVPSRLDEPFGNTAVESILAARPVVVSDTSGLREAAAGYRAASFVTPADAVAIADALAEIRSDWAARSAAALDDERIAADRHSVRAYQDRIIESVDGLPLRPRGAERIDA
ncbi:glycosyltransferase [Plantibacter sp. VKM Ac-2876]|nr:glycosyltransferase [Plantibacter sp. VKM Ac-2876]MBF4563545.1 glycosyltransferase [Plantibacter sp. VKM Ac-2876]